MESLLAASAPDYTPFYILAAGVVFVVLSIVKLRLHPFLGLTLGAVLVGAWRLTDSRHRLRLDRLRAGAE